MAGFWRKPHSALKTTQAVLAPDFPGMRISPQMPTTRPDRFIVLTLMPGEYTCPAFTVAHPVVECWAPTAEAAEDMCGTASAALHNAKGRWFAGAQVLGWGNEQGPAEFNDDAITDRVRWQLHGDLHISTH